MKPSTIRFSTFAAWLVLALLALLPASLSAQEWPQKPIKVIVPLAPGGAADLVMRAVGEEVSANIKQPVIIENRPGGGGTVAADVVARAAPDGYTLIMGNSGIFGIAPYLSKLPYDALKDFTPITTVTELPIVFVVGAAIPANTVAEFIDYAKKNPGKLSYGTSGYGSTMHLAGELLNDRTGIQMTHVPYKGGAAALVDLLSGQIPAVMATLSTAAPHIGGGKLKALATIEKKRSTSHPDIPTVGETLPGYAVPPSWMGFLGPAGLPEPVSAKLHAEFVRAVNAPHVRALLEKNGFEIVTLSPAAFADEISDGLSRFRKIVETAKMTPQ